MYTLLIELPGKSTQLVKDLKTIVPVQIPILVYDELARCFLCGYIYLQQL